MAMNCNTEPLLEWWADMDPHRIVLSAIPGPEKERKKKKVSYGSHTHLTERQVRRASRRRDATEPRPQAPEAAPGTSERAEGP